MLYPEILSRIHATAADYPAGNLSVYLNALTQQERGEILRVGLDRRYRFVDPLYHTFAQLTLLEQPVAREFAHDSVAELAAFMLARLMKDDPELKLIYFSGHQIDTSSWDASARQEVSAPVLSPREASVLRVASEGLSIQEIADRLYLSPHTVKSHLKRIYLKLGAVSRSQAILKAREMNLL